MRRVSAYIEVLAGAVTDDLKMHVAPDKLMFEVEKEVEKQLLSAMVQAVGKYSNLLTYSRDTVETSQRKNEMLRCMGYVQELFKVNDEIKGIITAGVKEIPEDGEIEILS